MAKKSMVAKQKRKDVYKRQVYIDIKMKNK